MCDYVICNIMCIFFTVPPEQPAILDKWGRAMNGTSSPYEEGDTLSLTCRVTGGTFDNLNL